MGPVAARFRTERREVWLTIDDGPDPEDTPRMLAILAQHGARATFFLIGDRARRHPELVRTILREGHIVGNHTFSHPVAMFWMAHPARVAREIDTCAASLRAASGKAASAHALFRAPVGMANPFVFAALQRRGMALVGWSARGFDAVEADSEMVVSRIWQTVRPGAIILLHEGHRWPGKEAVNPRTLALLLDRLAGAGYACVVPRWDQFAAYRQDGPDGFSNLSDVALPATMPADTARSGRC